MSTVSCEQSIEDIPPISTTSSCVMIDRRCHEHCNSVYPSEKRISAVHSPRPGLNPAIAQYRWLLAQPPVVSRDAFESIRLSAKRDWLLTELTSDWLAYRPSDRFEQTNQWKTSYQKLYAPKRLDEPTKLRPTSVSRRHRPQPSRWVFIFVFCLTYVFLW